MFGFKNTVRRLLRPSLFIALIGSGFVAGTAFGKSRYETYESRNAVVEGNGGSRTTKDGIDFWTMGDPPRRYQIIGIIRDNRGTGALFGNAIGSGGIAKMVRQVGGDAVIVVGQDSQIKGIWSQGSATAYGSQAFGTGLSVPIAERITTLEVVKYLQEQPAPLALVPPVASPSH